MERSKIRQNYIKLTAVLLLLVLFALTLCGCGGAAPDKNDAPGSTDASYARERGTDAEAYYERLKHCREQIEKLTDFRPEIVLVLGTGLNDYADRMDVIKAIPYSDIEGWPASTAPGHKGNLVFAEYKGLNIAVMQGRVHYYEGYTMDEVVLPLRVLHMLGADTAVITHAVGSLNEDFGIGEFMCSEDQISSFVPSPLIGENIEELGDRFVGMEDVLDKEMRDTMIRIGKDNNIPVHSGVFIQTSGPQFESKAEIDMYRSLGADTVGMSTAVETIAAAHMGMKVLDLNCISNMATGMEEEDFTGESIDKVMAEAAHDFNVLMDGFLDSLSKQNQAK
ncbi:MAG: purine-nucleoside phosphorylase [Mogibacterium sp.]|nr:purine-nucleoside phosphorylase [Mogibacterium sp.]